jgi:hypothetical protein
MRRELKVVRQEIVVGVAALGKRFTPPIPSIPNNYFIVYVV